jgi:hypothetical protein
MDEVQLMHDILSALPAAWQPHVGAVLQWMALLALLLPMLKSAAARVTTSPQARYWVDALFHVLDLLAANSKPMEDRPMPPPKRKERP